MALHKTAVVTVLTILSQILCCHCMPRNHLKSQLKSNAKHIYSQNDKLMKNRALFNNLTATNNLEDIRFPNVEYPFDSDIGEYYRFLKDYPVQSRPKKYMSNCSCQEQTNKIETKHKRKFDSVAKAKSQIMTSFTELDSEASFFPEVEYPLSAREMWIPTYRSRSQDVKQSGNVEIDRQVDQKASKNTPVSSNESGYKYEILTLNTLIKTLNAKEKQVTEMPGNLKVINKSGTGDILDVTMPSEMNIVNQPGPPASTSNNGSHGNIFTTVSTDNNVIDSKLFNPHEDSNDIIISNQISKNNSNVVNYKIASISNTDINSQLSIPDEDKGSHTNTPSIVIENAIPIPGNLSRPIEKIYTESTGITFTPDSDPSTYILTPLDYNSFPSMISDVSYYELTDLTTVAPFEYVTSPMSTSATLTNNIMLGQSTISPNPILTTNAPSSFSSAIVANDSPQKFLNWSINPNEAYITCRLPEDSDDWIIYVDTEKTLPSRESESDYTMTGDEDMLLDGFNCYLGERPQNEKSNSLISSCHSCPSSTSSTMQEENYQSRDIPMNTAMIVPTAPEHMGDSWTLVNDTENTTQSLEGNEYKSVNFVIENNTSVVPISKINDNMNQFLHFEDSNSTFQYEYIDDESVSVTEIPYDLAP